MIPKQLSDWSKAVVIDMLSKKLFESEQFDYKEALPNKGNKTAKKRLSKICCAFANSNGGFIVFGIDDDKQKKAKDRVIGVDPSVDFPEHFGNYPKNCVPSIYWEFLNPPISLGNSNFLHIIYIPKSAAAPHAVGSSDEGWHFTKRTNKGNEGMSIEEVRSNFLGFYEKHIKLNLLKTELEIINSEASSWRDIQTKNINSNYSLVTCEYNIIDSIISDSYTILAKEERLLSALIKLRQQIKITNNKTKIFFSIVSLPMSGKATIIREHNLFLRDKGDQITVLCDTSIKELSKYMKGYI